MNTNGIDYLRRRTVTAMLAVIILSGCNITKHVPANDALYMGAKVNIENQSGKEKINASELTPLIKPKPNSKILGLRLKLGIYNLAGKGNKGLNKLLKKYGEPPVLLSQVSLDRTSAILDNSVENRGYFHASVVGDTTIKDRKAIATYTVNAGNQYTINEVTFPGDSTRLDRAISNTADKSLLKKGDAFSLSAITTERLRIDAILKENGYFLFAPEQLIIFVDSTIGNDQVNLYVNLKPQVPPTARQQYSISKVYVYSDYNLNTAQRDTLAADTISFKGYNIVSSKHSLKPEVFDRIMMFSPADIYSRTDHNVTLARLINLGTFKYVKNRFEVLPDSSELDAYYYLTPSPRKSLSVEIGGLSKSNNVTGSELTLRYRNRNAFRGAELLTISPYFGTEIQYSGQFSGYNTLRYGVEANLTFPRFVLPIFNFNTKGSFVPRTAFKLGYDVLNRQNYFSLNSFRGEFGYLWKDNARTEHQLNPISINFVKPLNVTKEYMDTIASKPLLQRAIQKQFIIGSNYNFNYNQLADKPKYSDGIYFNGLVDLSGNIAGLLTGGNVRNRDTSKIFGVAFSQYIKTESDFRYYKKLFGKTQLASRIIVGVGVPYGNSRIMPYAKQFFIGGNNSLRAFRSRSVGPGKYFGGARVVGKSQILPDMTGDIKLEINSELRIPLNNIFSTAVFVDAGNIWLFNEDPQQPGGKFSKDFLKELAVGAGVGLRIDVTILVLRLDVGVPLRIPYLPLGTRYVGGQIISDKDFRKQNMVFNLAIGYPF